MSIVPNGKRRVSKESQSLMYQNTGLDGSDVSQEIASTDPASSGPAANFEQLQNDLNAPTENAEVPDMSGMNDQMGDQGSLDDSEISTMRNELIDALAQVDVDPERARIVAKKALSIGYKNPAEDILAGEFLVPAKDNVPITQVKAVFAPIIAKNGFTLTSLKPHQNTGKSGKRVIDYWKLEFETQTEDPNAQQIEGDYADMMDESDMGGQQIAASSKHSFIKNAGRSLLLESLLEQFAKQREMK